MISFTDQQLAAIKALKPLTGSCFLYSKARWQGLDDAYIHLIQAFEDKDISREDVIHAYKAYYNNPATGCMKAFLLTMIWGFAEAGYGPYRTNNYLKDSHNIEYINNALDFIHPANDDGLKKAFNELNKIKGLGVSYLTKILYFATRAQNIEKYALIFDIRVATSLVKLTTPEAIFKIVQIAPSPKFADYEKFNSLMHSIAANNHVEAEQLEMYLFDQKFA